MANYLTITDNIEAAQKKVDAEIAKAEKSFDDINYTYPTDAMKSAFVAGYIKSSLMKAYVEIETLKEKLGDK